MSEKRDRSFEIRWNYFLVAIFFPLIVVAFSLFARESKRDKFYSALFGLSINLLLSYLLLLYYDGKMPY
jgi:uncharacterized membrane protein